MSGCVRFHLSTEAETRVYTKALQSVHGAIKKRKIILLFFNSVMHNKRVIEPPKITIFFMQMFSNFS